MMNAILTGQKPTEVFKSIVRSDSTITNTKLANMFKTEFVEVKAEAIQAIWQWNRPGRGMGIDDDRMDAIVINYLKEAGYL
jgi:hypothetical protein